MFWLFHFIVENDPQKYLYPLLQLSRGVNIRSTVYISYNDAAYEENGYIRSAITI